MLPGKNTHTHTHTHGKKHTQIKSFVSDSLLGIYKKPYVAVIDGITMGGVSNINVFFLSISVTLGTVSLELLRTTTKFHLEFKIG